jgi:hypothetical protein
MFLHSFGLRELTADMRSAGLKIDRTERLTVGGESTVAHRWFFGGIRAGGFIVAGKA